MNLQVIADAMKHKHSRYVSKISGLLAEHLGYSESESDIIKEAALYHDIGKHDIPAEILAKPGALNAKEFNTVKRHTRLGCERIKKAVKVLNAASDIAENHHEKLDGTGYRRLAAEQIHPYVRLVSVADVFDALYSKRPYKKAWPISEIVDYFNKKTGIKFDEEVVCVLLDILDEITALYN